VIGARPIATIEHFSRSKRILQHLGSSVIRTLSGTEVADAPSGFRAISREAALRLNVFDGYTYTLESIIQAGLSNIRIESVPIHVNGETRPSRLVRSNLDYVCRSIGAMLRAFFIYQPGKTFFYAGLPCALIGGMLMTRWIVLYFAGTSRAHVPSLVVAAVLLIVAALLWISGLLGELFAINRRLLQDIQYMMRRDGAAKDGSNGGTNGG
jgi:hypothetical protein